MDEHAVAINSRDKLKGGLRQKSASLLFATRNTFRNGPQTNVLLTLNLIINQSQIKNFPHGAVECNN